MWKVEHELERVGAKISHFIKTGNIVVVVVVVVAKFLTLVCEGEFVSR